MNNPGTEATLLYLGYAAFLDPYFCLVLNIWPAWSIDISIKGNKNFSIPGKLSPLPISLLLFHIHIEPTAKSYRIHFFVWGWTKV